MDAWMADPVLNANDAVATWHQRAQRCGFKSRRLALRGTKILVLNRNMDHWWQEISGYCPGSRCSGGAEWPQNA